MNLQQQRRTPLAPRAAKLRWEVIHACDTFRDVADLVEAQITADIRPYVLSRLGLGSSEPGSLFGAWSEVRQWRRQFDDYAAATSIAAPIIHAHTFPAGMAGVRSPNPVVYDLRNFVEALSEPSRSWLGRSFRAAEQFVLAQAGAVVVHSRMIRKACLARGANEERLLLIPDPVALPQNYFREETGELSIFVEQPTPVALAALGRARKHTPLRVIASTRAEAAEQVLRAASEWGLGDALSVVLPEGAGEALLHATAAIAVSERLAVEVMRHQVALLGEDSSELRDASPDGQGCLWFEAGSIADLARKIIFLAEHRDFRIALGQAGAAYLQTVRSPEKIGQAYDEVYRYVWARKRQGSVPPDGNPVIAPAY